MRLTDLFSSIWKFFRSIVNRLALLFSKEESYARKMEPPARSKKKSARKPEPPTLSRKKPTGKMAAPPRKMEKPPRDQEESGAVPIELDEELEMAAPEPPPKISKEESPKLKLDTPFSSREPESPLAPGPEARKKKTDANPQTSSQPVHAVAPPQADIVNISVYCPEEAIAGQSFLLNVYAHLYEQKAEVAEMARQADENARLQVGKTLNAPVLRGTTLSVQLIMEGCTVDETQQQMVWFGMPTSVEFEVSVPSEHPGGQLIGILIVSNMYGPVGRFKFNLQLVSGKVATNSPGEAIVESLAYSRAYTAFSPEDITAVDAHLQQLKQTGISFVRAKNGDSENWETELVRQLRESELFYLFWSVSAEKSLSIEAEWQYALQFYNTSDNRLPDIIPVVVEDPGPAPPEELSFLNFSASGLNPAYTLKERCNELLSKWQVSLFDLLIDYFKSDENTQNELIGIRRRWHSLADQKRKGLTTGEEYKKSKLSLTYDIQFYIGQIT